jgi:probable phosphoglycerate mutase
VKETILIFLRHGESEANVGHIFNSRDATLHPLTDLGRRQARRAAETLAAQHPAAIYASPLLRARQTAEIIAALQTDVPLCFDDRLREVDCGDMEFRSGPDCEATYAEVQNVWAQGRLLEAMGGGETAEDLRNRLRAVIAEITDKHAEQTVFVVCHVALLRWGMTALLADWTPAITRHWKVPHAVPFALRADSGGFSPVKPLAELRSWEFPET